MKSHFILYVLDQERASAFYSKVLNRQPDLYVPGMTEFMLSPTSVLGLMPEAGIAKLLGAAFPDLGDSSQQPRAEIYLLVSNVDEVHARALAAGATELSPPQQRDWGHRVGYSLDPDGHVLAVAQAE
jgi:uncharacterized protein